jgi:FKBP-type peptidyl-prolyl cis-trans isomerase
MIKRTLTAPVLVLLAVGVTACGGSSKAPGVVLAPSGGATVAAATTPATTSTPTATTPTATTPTSGPLSKEPTVTVIKGPAPKVLITKDLIKGTGALATPTSSVVVNYVGALANNGKVFDASWKRNQTFPVVLGQGQVIQGWDKGIPGMRVGGRRELIIPAGLAYKSAAQPGIPANSALVFIVDLLAAS